MSETSRRQTRSQTALSRAHTPDAPSSRDEPQAPASIRSKASTRRSAVTQPLLKTETSTTYGSKGQKTLAQQLSAQEVMNKAVNLIETEVTGAVAGPSRRLSTVNEEGADGDAGNELASVVDRGNVSGKEKDLSALELTGPPKSFHREVVDETDSDLPPRGDPSDWHDPVFQENSLLARLMSSPILGLLFLLLTAVIAFMSVAMWVGWRPLDESLAHGEYNKSFVHKEFVKMTHVLERQGLQLGARFETQDRQIWERFEAQDRDLEDRVQELIQEQDTRVNQRVDEEHRVIQEQDARVNERIDKEHRLIQEQDTRVNERIDKEHRVLQQLKSDFESAYLKVRQPGDGRVNYFSRGLAAVSTRFSSPTLANPLNFKEQLATVRLELGKLPTWQTEKPVFEDPMSIFNPWESFGQKWCAPSRRGKLQAVVRLGYKIAPTEILIEHMRKSQMPDVEIGTAPKEVELWIQVLDEGVRRKVIDAIQVYHPSIMTKLASQRGKTIDPRLALDKTWVPVGRWNYNIHTIGNNQGFYVPIDLSEMGVKTQAVALRVNSNWGSMDSTCLYRVRLYGEYQEAPTEFTDLEEIPDEVILNQGKPTATQTPFQYWKRYYARHPRQA